MRKIVFFTSIILLIFHQLKAQYGNFRKYQIAQTGYYCYFPSDPGEFEKQQSDDGQNLYLAETNVNNVTFGIVAVLFDNSFSSYGKTELEELLISYMDHLQQTFEIQATTGYGKGHTLFSNPDAIGVIDYWQKKNGDEVAVKGWIDSKALAFLYISGKELPNINVQGLFFNGFTFKN